MNKKNKEIFFKLKIFYDCLWYVIRFLTNKCVISQESNGFFKISQFDLENDYN